MLPRVDTNIRPIAAIEAPSAVATIGATKQETATLFDQLVIGKQIRGEILSRLTDGTFFVKLAGATARMALPQSTQVGEHLPLTLIALIPRPTFLLATGQGNATTTATFSRQDLIENFIRAPKIEQDTLPSKGSAPETSVSYIIETEQSKNTTILTSKTIADVANHPQTEVLRTTTVLPSKLITDSNVGKLTEPTELNTTSTPTSLSDTGKLINNILQQAQQQGAPSALIGKTPLLTSAEELKQPDKLARHLQQTISASGIFYEAHVADWAEGKMSRADLMREPQSQLGNTSANIANATTAEDYSKLAQIIHLQLDVLEQQKISWQGQLLPGLPFDWEITQQDRQAQTESDVPESSWQSVVRFELPNLGVVAATINFHAGQLQLFLRSDADETVNVLKENSLDLIHALDGAGAPLTSLHVKHDEQA